MTEQTCFTQVPNWIFDHMGKWPLSVQSIVMTIARHTYGWQKAKDVISLTQFEQATGLSRQGVVNALVKAEALGIIKRTQLVNSVDYQLVNSVDYLNSTSQLSVPELVNSVDTQKKRKKDHEDVVAAVASTSSPMAEEPATSLAPELTQPTLTAVSEPHPPRAAAPPAPSKPKRERKPPASADVQALYDPLHELTGVPRKSHAAIALRVAAGNLRTEYQATADEVPAFGKWFAKHSTAARVAQREQRPLGPPTVRQVYGLWGQYVIWRDAQRPPPRPTVIPDDDRPLAKFAPGEARARYERIRAEMAERNQRAAAD